MQALKDSVETSVTIGKFKTLEEASMAHIFNSEFMNFPMSKMKDMENFNSELRLTPTPYPNRPRGPANMQSVLFHRGQIKRFGHVQPIFVFKNKNEYTLLDGAHRIVATFLERNIRIPAFIISSQRQ